MSLSGLVTVALVVGGTAFAFLWLLAAMVGL